MNNEDVLIIILVIILVSMVFYEKYKFEYFGELDPDNIQYNDNLNIGEGITASKFGETVTNINPPNPQNPDYNNLNNIGKLVTDTGTGYFQNRIKIVDNENSPLLKLYAQNQNEIYNKIKKCDIQSSQPTVQKSNIHGYNNFVYGAVNDDDSYAQITSIGKNLLTPYIDFPVGYADVTTKP